MIARALLIEEAGEIISDADNGERYIETENVIAISSGLIKIMLIEFTRWISLSFVYSLN
jgi:hypothetical protein